MRMIGDFTVYRHYIFRIGAASIVGCAVCGLGCGFFTNFNNIWLKFWSVDISTEHPKYPDSFYLGLYACFQFSRLLYLLMLWLICFMTVAKIVGARLHKKTPCTVMSAPLRFFTATDNGAVTNIFSQDLTLIYGHIQGSLVDFAIYMFSCLGMAAVVATSSPLLATTYPFFAIIPHIIQKFYLRTSRQVRLLNLEAKKPTIVSSVPLVQPVTFLLGHSTHFMDSIKGIATFLAFG
ncbi:ABC transporter FUM19 [Metarhizium brunneum]|uniref:ABC transporter FUM19 n=1 Tax=Metarhizium brunneum TaxID=500148 RepID=A0A7D5YR89_9HYPO|nr:ABC transporter FUM19 [Metarhizium brunneum]